MTEHAVVIVGGGPTGLMLAGELALAGVNVAIVERRPNQDLPGSRAGGLHSRTLEILDQRGIVDRFIAACAGGDIAELVAVLDPDVDGHAELIGFGPIADEAGRPAVAQRLIGLFGPGTDSVLLPMSVPGEDGIVVYAHGRVAAFVRLEHDGAVIRHMRAFVLPPSR